MGVFIQIAFVQNAAIGFQKARKLKKINNHDTVHFKIRFSSGDREKN